MRRLFSIRGLIGVHRVFLAFVGALTHRCDVGFAVSFVPVIARSTHPSVLKRRLHLDARLLGRNGDELLLGSEDMVVLRPRPRIFGRPATGPGGMDTTFTQVLGPELVSTRRNQLWIRLLRPRL